MFISSSLIIGLPCLFNVVVIIVSSDEESVNEIQCMYLALIIAKIFLMQRFSYHIVIILRVKIIFRRVTNSIQSSSRANTTILVDYF